MAWPYDINPEDDPFGVPGVGGLLSPLQHIDTTIPQAASTYGTPYRGLLGSAPGQDVALAIASLGAGIAGGQGRTRGEAWGSGLQQGMTGLLGTAALSGRQKALEQEVNLREQARQMQAAQMAFAQSQILQRQAAVEELARQRPELAPMLRAGLGADYFKVHNVKPGESLIFPAMTGGPAVPGQTAPGVLASVPERPTLHDLGVPGVPGAKQPTWLIPGQTTGTAVGAPKLPQPPMSVSTHLQVDTGKSLAGKVGDIAEAAQAQADSAVTQIANNNRVLAALNSGPIIAGPGAQLGIKAVQIGNLLNIAGKDDAEKLLNTRRVIQGMSEATLAARGMLKGQGAVSEYEQKTLEKARSGNIEELTQNEIKTIFQVANRAAKEQHKRASERLSVIQKDPKYSEIAPFYKATDLPAFPGAPPIGEKRGGYTYTGGDPSDQTNWEK